MLARTPFLYIEVPSTMSFSVWPMTLRQNRSTAFAVILATALAMLAFLTRQMVVAVQDRLIRLEMRLRLRQLLPPDLQPQINALSPRQLVALRFASDGELPDLVRDVLAGKLTTPKDIKLHVKSWQSDWMRA